MIRMGLGEKTASRNHKSYSEVILGKVILSAVHVLSCYDLTCKSLSPASLPRGLGTRLLASWSEVQEKIGSLVQFFFTIPVSKR